MNLHIDHNIGRPCSEVTPSTDTYKRASKLLSLPNELILEIFKKLPRLELAISLALADDILGMIGVGRIGELLTAELAPWAGHHLICFGDYTNDHDFPSSIQPLVFEQLGINPKGLNRKASSSKFFYFVYESYTTRFTSPKGQWHTAIFNMIRVFIRYTKLSKGDRQKFGKLIAGLEALPFDETYARQANLVLCNLSRYEYVRGSEVERVFRGRLTLGHVLLSRIGRSSTMDGTGSSPYSLIRGKWAGNRFEVVKPDEMKTGVEWKDVTSECIKYLRGLLSDTCEV